MKAPNLIASIAAILITATTLGIISHHVDHVAPVAYVNGIRVTDLAPVNVQPSAAERRADALQTDTGSSNGPGRLLGHSDETGATTPLGLLSAQLAMPYYSFGNKFGRLSSKE